MHDAIATSRAHLYAAWVEWSQRFNNAAIFLLAADRAYVMRPVS
jgi:hypothetical protein